MYLTYLVQSSGVSGRQLLWQDQGWFSSHCAVHLKHMICSLGISYAHKMHWNHVHRRCMQKVTWPAQSLNVWCSVVHWISSIASLQSLFHQYRHAGASALSDIAVLLVRCATSQQLWCSVQISLPGVCHYNVVDIYVAKPNIMSWKWLTFSLVLCFTGEGKAGRHRCTNI